MTTFSKYLERFAECESNIARRFVHQWKTLRFDRCVAIPCYSEGIEFSDRLFALNQASNQSILTIIVINRPDKRPPCHLNIELLQHIFQFGHLIANYQHIYFIQSDQHLWVVVERSELGAPIPEKQGVGLARKIACDIACEFHRQGLLTTPWVYSTDADTFLPKNYYQVQFNSDASAATFNFSHINTGSQISQATLLYEKSLHYYVNGLSWANSSYAYYTIGSALAVNLNFYCLARGFPRRNGAEDFYLLNKLAKMARVDFFDEIQINIESRLSQRVPFGTGPAVKKLIDGEELKFNCYHPQCFAELKCWNEQKNKLFSAVHNHSSQSALDSLSLSSEAKKILTQLKCEALFTHIKKQSKSNLDCQKITHHWFDAFKTLKFIRLMGQYHYANIPISDAIEKSPFSLN